MKDTKRDRRYSKKEKLRKNYQFQAVYRQGRSLATKTTVLFLRKNNEGINRLGISISKKVGKSVVRHRLKRLYIEAYRNLKPDITKSGFDFVIIARKGADNLTYADAVKDLEKLLGMGKLLK